MKHVKSLIKLTNRNSEGLNDKEQSRVIAGLMNCVCGCFYAGCGGSNTEDNRDANAEDGLHSQVPLHHEWAQESPA